MSARFLHFDLAHVAGRTTAIMPGQVVRVLDCGEFRAIYTADGQSEHVRASVAEVMERIEEALEAAAIPTLVAWGRIARALEGIERALHLSAHAQKGEPVGFDFARFLDTHGQPEAATRLRDLDSARVAAEQRMGDALGRLFEQERSDGC